MKRIALLLAAVTGALLLQPAASAHHRPSSSCSESGDVCVSATKVDGVRKLQIGLAAKYFDRYQLCVTAPDKSVECHRFAIGKRANGSFGDSVRWGVWYEDGGPGAYTVRWKNAGNTLGTAGFHTY
ncbi:MAG: hypothetical protein QOH90_1409 [Actinomycetota bacterium]|jgi:hypothetical protein|nr:hypothetical protein [Actinomycetota bacterium]